MTSDSLNLGGIGPRGRSAYAESKKPWIEGRSLVIIDDIITTGSTVSEIAKTLLEAGASDVSAIALAHTEYSI